MCPACGAPRGRVIENDETEDGLPLRERRCPACGSRYPTVEIPFTGASIMQVGTKRRDVRRRSARARRGFHGMRSGTYLRPYARLETRVTVIWWPSKQKTPPKRG